MLALCWPLFAKSLPFHYLFFSSSFNLAQHYRKRLTREPFERTHNEARRQPGVFWAALGPAH